jgi:hypothetical protein
MTISCGTSEELFAAIDMQKLIEIIIKIAST